jgi:hypothetical protein
LAEAHAALLVVAVALAEAHAVSVLVEVIGAERRAVIVEAVAEQLVLVGVLKGVGVVAVACTLGPAVQIAIEILVDEPISVVIEAIAELVGEQRRVALFVDGRVLDELFFEIWSQLLVIAIVIFSLVELWRVAVELVGIIAAIGRELWRNVGEVFEVEGYAATVTVVPIAFQICFGVGGKVRRRGIERRGVVGLSVGAAVARDILLQLVAIGLLVCRRLCVELRAVWLQLAQLLVRRELSRCWAFSRLTAEEKTAGGEEEARESERRARILSTIRRICSCRELGARERANAEKPFSLDGLRE